LSTEDVEQIIMPSLTPIIEISQYLVLAFEARLAENGGNFQDMLVGDLFVTIEGELLSRYSPYVMDYELSIFNLARFKKARPMFASFLQVLQDSPKTRFRNMDDYQITVVQRLPRYMLLLSDLVKNTRVDHVDYVPMTRALESIKTGIENLNSEKKLHQLRSFGREIVSAFAFQDMQSSNLVYEANISKTPHPTPPTKWQYKILLYDDQILLIKYKQELLELVKRVNLWDAKITQHVPKKRNKSKEEGVSRAIKFGNTVYYLATPEIREYFMVTFSKAMASSLQ